MTGGRYTGGLLRALYTAQYVYSIQMAFTSSTEPHSTAVNITLVTLDNDFNVQRMSARIDGASRRVNDNGDDTRRRKREGGARESLHEAIHKSELREHLIKTSARPHLTFAAARREANCDRQTATGCHTSHHTETIRDYCTALYCTMRASGVRRLLTHSYIHTLTHLRMNTPSRINN